MTQSKDGKLQHGIAHERLAIMDPESGAQPLRSEDESVTIAVNGEVYNYKELYKTLATPYSPKTGSDCEVLLPLYEQYGPSEKMGSLLRGMFSYILYDEKKDLFMICRDHIGITPLYIGWGKDGSTWVSSEMKALVDQCVKFEQFPPGHFYCNQGHNAGKFVRWYKPSYVAAITPIGGPLPTTPYNADILRDAFEKAVVKRMMSDVPWGVLLSGGLDSSLVASIASRHIKRKNPAFPKLHSFCVGLPGAPDLAAAKKVRAAHTCEQRGRRCACHAHV